MSKNKSDVNVVRGKVQGLYDCIGARGLYVNTNHDVFVGPKEVFKAGTNGQFEYTILQDGGRAYASPLLFATLTSLLNRGSLLLTGAPGIGKTTGAEFAGHFFTGTPLDDILEATIQGHPQQTEEKMIARYHTGKLVKEGEEKVLPRKFMTCGVKLIDEINRLDPDKLSIVMRLIDTGKAVYGNELLEATQGPLFATANYTDAGTFELTPPLLDRFDAAVVVTSPQPWDLKNIFARSDEKLNGGLKELLDIPADLKLSVEDLACARKNINELPKSEDVEQYMNFVLATIRYCEAASDDVSRMTKGNAWSTLDIEGGHFNDHPSAYTKNELSVRTARAWQRYARALAWFTGKDSVDEESVKTVFPYAVWHKLQPSDKALQEPGKIANDRIYFAKKLLEKIDEQWVVVQGENCIKYWSYALQAIQNPKQHSMDSLRTIVKNAITKIAMWDNPYSTCLAKHLESEYNRQVMK